MPSGLHEGTHHLPWVGDVHGGSEMPANWYVTVEVHKRGTLPRRRSPRLTSTFENGAEAKNFARAKLQEGLVVFAGSINPFRGN